MSTERPKPDRRRRRRDGFRPPHCPNPACPHHRNAEGWRFVRKGFFTRKSDRRSFPIFRCRTCRRWFSSRTFSATYWLKRRDLLSPIASWLPEGPGLRQIARHFRVSHITVMRHAARLGRHCLLFHTRMLASEPPLRLLEPLVVDGFESFAHSQFYPFHFNLAAGRDSWFLYGFNDAPLRRKGSMTEEQKQRRAELEETYGTPDPKAVERSMGNLLREMLALLPPGKPLVLHSDEHPAYLRALDTLRAEPDCPGIEHQVTSSKERRTMSNPLFPVNLADLRIRHGQANHRRETIAFSKHFQAAIERMAVFLVWANCVKKMAENGEEISSAMAVGLTKRRLEWRDVLRRRLFPTHWKLSQTWETYYRRLIRTPPWEGREANHTLAHAF